MQKNFKYNCRLSPEIESIIKNVFEKSLFRSNHYSGADIYRELIVIINSANRTRSQEDQLPIPHKCTIYARINSFQCDRIKNGTYTKKERKKLKNKNYTQVEKDFSEMVVDDTFIDLCLLDNNAGVQTGNIIITMMLNDQTQYPLAAQFSIVPPKISS